MYCEANVSILLMSGVGTVHSGVWERMVHCRATLTLGYPSWIPSILSSGLYYQTRNEHAAGLDPLASTSVGCCAISMHINEGSL